MLGWRTGDGTGWTVPLELGRGSLLSWEPGGRAHGVCVLTPEDLVSSVPGGGPLVGAMNTSLPMHPHCH